MNATFLRPGLLPDPALMPQRLRKRCRKCGKIRWLTREDAQAAMAPGGDYYQCGDYWHWTSRSGSRKADEARQSAHIRTAPEAPPK